MAFESAVRRFRWSGCCEGSALLPGRDQLLCRICWLSWVHNRFPSFLCRSLNRSWSFGWKMLYPPLQNRIYTPFEITLFIPLSSLIHIVHLGIICVVWYPLIIANSCSFSLISSPKYSSHKDADFSFWGTTHQKRPRSNPPVWLFVLSTT